MTGVKPFTYGPILHTCTLCGKLGDLKEAGSAYMCLLSLPAHGWVICTGFMNTANQFSILVLDIVTNNGYYKPQAKVHEKEKGAHKSSLFLMVKMKRLLNCALHEKQNVYYSKLSIGVILNNNNTVQYHSSLVLVLCLALGEQLLSQEEAAILVDQGSYVDVQYSH